MESTIDSVEKNADLLLQGARLLRDLDEAAFVAGVPASPGGSVGKHIRHCVDCYDALLGGLPRGRVDYSRRERDARSEEDPRRAALRLEETARALRGLSRDDLERPIAVRGEDDDAGADDERSWSASTVSRELQFLRSHTIHHLALVAILLRLGGIEPPAHLGIAPSTLRHREAVRRG